MATKVFMEALSPTMEEGRLVKWLKNEGDAVKSGETIAEVETDKAVMELVARGDGVLRKRMLAEGGTSPVGQVIAVIAGADENVDEIAGGGGGGGDAKQAAPKQQDQGQQQPEQQQAQGGQQKQGGQQQQQQQQPPAQQRSQQQPAREQGTKEEQAGAKAPAAQQTSPTPAPRGQQQAPRGDGGGDGQRGGGDGGRVRSSPLARRLANEQGLELGGVQGSGPGGRIVKKDIEAALQAGPQTGTRGAQPAARSPQSAADYEDVPLTQIRKTIARRLSESLGPIPTFYLTAEIDMGRAAEMRLAMAKLGDDYKVSFNDIVLKGVALALAEHPECNAHWMGDHIRYFSRVHLAMAVAIPDGLITPVLFDADQMRLRDISKMARELATRARERKLKPEEYTGSTFSVSNLGMFGIDQFTAIINPPEVGILAVGGVEDKAVVVDGAITMAKHMRVTMSCDHRVIDGATGAKFLQTLRRMLENPLMMLY